MGSSALWLARVAGLAAVIGVAAPARAQNALGTGYNLQTDLNTGGANSFRRYGGPGNNSLNNAIMTGNAVNGLDFQGRRGFGNPYEFQGRLGSDDVSRFERNSISSRAASFGVSAGQIASFQRAALTGARTAPGIGGSLIAARNPYASQTPSPALGYKASTTGYTPQRTTMSASGGFFGVDPFGRTRNGLTRDVGLADVDRNAAGYKAITPGGLGGERNLMRDLSSQLNTDISRQSIGNSPTSTRLDSRGVPTPPIGGLDRPAGSTASGAPTGVSGRVPDYVGGLPGVPGLDESPSGAESRSPFVSGPKLGLNSALKAGKGYDTAVLARASNPEGWRQQQTADVLNGIRIRTEPPPGLVTRPTLPDMQALRDPRATMQDPTTGPTIGAGGAGQASPTGMLNGDRLDTSATPRTAYELMRDRMTGYSKKTEGARADGSDLLSYTLTKREAGGLTGLDANDVLGMPPRQARSALGRPGADRSLTGFNDLNQDNMPEWERRVNDLRARLRQQAVVDTYKATLAGTKEAGAEQANTPGVKIPFLIQPPAGPSVDMWRKSLLPPVNSVPDTGKDLKGKEIPKEAKTDEQGMPVRSHLPSVRLDPTTLKIIRESGGKVDTYVNAGAAVRDQYPEFMKEGQRLMTAGRYFDAEEQFARAMNESSADVTAMIARTHAQIGAGLYVSAGSNLLKTLTEFPETAGPRYAADLLPKPERMDRVMAQLRGYMKFDDDLARASSLLMAYLGHQRQDAAAVAEGLDNLARIGKEQLASIAPNADRQLLEDEGRLVEFLRGVWQAK